MSRETPERPLGSAERRLLVWLFVVMAAAFSIVQEGAITGYDGRTVYEVTRSVAERKTLAISTEFNTLPGADGRAYSRYGLGLSLLAMLPYVAVRPLALASGHADQVLEAAVSFVMGFVGAALVVAVYLLARRVGAGIGAALVVGVGAVAGTFVLPYVKEFFSEPLTTLCIVIAIERSLAGRWSAAGLSAGAAVLVRPQSLLFVAVLLFVVWAKGGLRQSMLTSVTAAPGVLLTFAYNTARFGAPLRFGYEDVGFTTPLLEGLTGLLFEPRKSILLFAPISVLVPAALWRLRRTHPAAAVLLTGHLCITVGTVAMWFAWHGGWSWGPRLLMPGLIPAVAAVAPWMDRPRRRWVAALLLMAGFAVSVSALVVPTQAQQLEAVRRTRAERLRGHFMRTQPLDSPSAVRQLQLVTPTARYSWQHKYDHLNDGRNYLRYLSLWQFGAMRVMQQRGLLISLCVTSLLVLVMIVGAGRLRAAIREASESESAARPAS